MCIMYCVIQLNFSHFDKLVVHISRWIQGKDNKGKFYLSSNPNFDS